LSLVLDDVNAIASADQGKQNEVSWSLECRWEALPADADQSPIDLYLELGTGQQAVTGRQDLSVPRRLHLSVVQNTMEVERAERCPEIVCHGLSVTDPSTSTHDTAMAVRRNSDPCIATS
jgi:hypothetical protein